MSTSDTQRSIEPDGPDLKIYHYDYDLTKNIGNEDDLSAQICIQACLKFHERAKYPPNMQYPVDQDQDIISSVTYIENEDLLKEYEEEKEHGTQYLHTFFEECLFHGTDKEIRLWRMEEESTCQKIQYFVNNMGIVSSFAKFQDALWRFVKVLRL